MRKALFTTSICFPWVFPRTLRHFERAHEDLAAVDVQNRLKRVEARLPSVVTQQGLIVTKSRSNFLMFIGLTKAVKVGDTVPATLTFASGAKVKATFVASVTPPAAAEHHH